MVIPRRLPYLDTSVIIPFLGLEEGSLVVQRIVSDYTLKGELPILLSEMTKLEFSCTMARHYRIGIQSREKTKFCLELLDRWFLDRHLMLPILSNDFLNARKFIDQLTQPLKGPDALHLAVAQANHAVLITADRQLAAAAFAFGVKYHYIPYS